MDFCKQSKGVATLRLSRGRAAEESLRAEETENCEHLLSRAEKLLAENTGLRVHAEAGEADCGRVQALPDIVENHPGAAAPRISGSASCAR